MSFFESTTGLMIFIWLCLIIVFLVAEFLTTTLTTIWFAAGSLVALVVTLAGGGTVAQIVVFVVVSILLLALTKPFASKILRGRAQRTNADRAIGQVVKITERVSNIDGTGKAQLQGMDWMVRTIDDAQVIEEGASAMVLDIRGVTLIVEGLGKAKEE
ncbi:MAG: NfeD family protein [Clostridiales bacterium]|nr:NfeD family protein [Clostridiales bacterium]